MELADTSVWGKQRRPGMEWFARALEDGLIAVCDMVAMEVLTSARDDRDFRQIEQALTFCPWLTVEAEDWTEARRVYGLLAEQGPLHHRAVKIPDLLIAAVGGRNSVTVVHYDEDYDRIAALTGQPVRWAAPRGSL
jgi:predicted nucleic acid-binding protein